MCMSNILQFMHTCLIPGTQNFSSVSQALKTKTEQGWFHASATNALEKLLLVHLVCNQSWNCVVIRCRLCQWGGSKSWGPLANLTGGQMTLLAILMCLMILRETRCERIFPIKLCCAWLMFIFSIAFQTTEMHLTQNLSQLVLGLNCRLKPVFWEKWRQLLQELIWACESRTRF